MYIVEGTIAKNIKLPKYNSQISWKDVQISFWVCSERDLEIWYNTVAFPEAANFEVKDEEGKIIAVKKKNYLEISYEKI